MAQNDDEENDVNFILIGGVADIEDSSSVETPIAEADDGIGCLWLFGFGLVAFFIYFGFPVSLWILGTATVAAFTHPRLWDEPADNKISDIRVALIDSLRSNFHTIFFYVSLSLLALVVFQVGFNFFDSHYQKNIFLKIHEKMSDSRKLIDSVLDWRYFLLLFPMLVLSLVLLPGERVVHQYLSMRNVLEKMMIVLITFGAFSVAYYGQTVLNDRAVIGEMAWALNAEKDKLDEIKYDVAVNVALTKELSESTEVEIDYLVDYLESANERERKSRIVRAFASSVLNEPQKNTGGSGSRGRANAVFGIKYPSEVAERRSEIKQQTTTATQSRTLAVETLDIALSQLLPSELKPIGKVFLDALRKSTVETFVGKFDVRLTDVRSRLFALQLNLATPDIERLSRIAQGRRGLIGTQVTENRLVEGVRYTPQELVEWVDQAEERKEERKAERAKNLEGVLRKKNSFPRTPTHKPPRPRPPARP